MAALLTGTAPPAPAQARPEGSRRAWIELGIGGASQATRCSTCLRTADLSGPTLSLAGGYSLPRGFGVAVLGRAFQEFSFDYSQGSRYVLALAQYTAPSLNAITLNAGMGWGRHHGERAPYAIDGEGTVLSAGVALRAPAHSAAGLSLTLDVVQSVSGASSSRPRLVSVGLALNVASRDVPPPR